MPSTIVLWSFCGIRELLSLVNETAFGKLTLFSIDGKLIKKDLSSAIAELVSHNAFLLRGKLGGVLVEATISPIDFRALEGVENAKNREWSSAFRTYRSKVSYCRTHEVSSYPSTLNLWLDESESFAVEWAREHFRAGVGSNVRAGICEGREQIDAPGLVSPNPWLIARLDRCWPRLFSTYVISEGAVDAQELTAIATRHSKLNGLIYLYFDPQAISSRISTVKLYPDMAAANRMFRSKAD